MSAIAPVDILLLFLAAGLFYWVIRAKLDYQKQLHIQRRIGEILIPHDVQESANDLLSTIADFDKWTAASLFVVDQSDGNLLRCIGAWTKRKEDREYADATSKLLFSRGSGLVGSVFASGKVLFIDNLQKTPFERQALAERLGLRSALIFPLFGRESVVAVCELLSDRRLGKPNAVFYDYVGRQIARYVDRDMKRLHISEREAELRAIIDAAADGIFCCDETGKVEWANKAALKLLGYEEAEVVGGNVVDFLPEAYKRRFGNALTHYFRTTVGSMVGRTTEVSGQHKNGTTFPLELSVSHLKFGEREIFTAIVRDLSERKLVEKRIRQFYSIVSHELRSPLASIRGSLGLIEGGAVADGTAEDVKELVQIARKNCDRLIRLINDMLDAKRLEAGKFSVVKQPLSADEAITWAIEGMRSTAAEAQVNLVCSAACNKQVIGDADRVVQVLTNLISNAIKFSPAGSQVEVSAGPGINGDKFLRFSVKDYGPGISSEHLGDLFSEFRQLDASDSRRRGGAGLGLSISKGIVEELDGQIGVDNRHGSGALFWFELPLVVDEERAQKQVAQ